ncbi:PAS domain-containing protein [Dolichospermum circinale CS-534/05]|uniref:GAF domain-containing protein n=1 Tax=Dolichospermum circinale TaxID=109265 RepID=UPI00232AE851|nr:GAF domain-containing protein [Dolichospermum circinale]MDB9492035.1 PAS domain-containing protein [Dolichospermum circinale CS-534/05]
MLIPVNAISATELKSAIIYNPLLATADTTVREAVVQMSGIAVNTLWLTVPAVCSIPQTANNYLEHLQIQACCSCVLIVENNRPVGIFTQQDVVELSIQKPNLEDLALREVMTHPVITLQESKFTDLFFTLNLLQHHRIRHLPLVDEENQLVGLLTYESLRQILRPVDLLRLRLVHEVMTTNVLCAPANVSILAIARLMAENQVSSVMIVETPASLTIPLGMVTEHDIVQLKALSVNFDTCLAQTVMSTPVFCVTVDESLWNVQQIMEQRFIQRLAVTGSKGELVGIVTHSSILEALNPWELYKLTAVLQEKVLQLETEKIQLLGNRTLELEKQIEERTIKLRRKAEQEKLINQIATQIHSSLDLQEILNNTVVGVRSLLNCDRVIVYQFSGDFRGQVIAEAIITGESVLNQEVHDPCISPEWLELYRQGQIRVINDINTESITQCHQQMLKDLDIRGKLLSPLIVENQLWGLMLASYRDIPHNWELEEIELVQQISLRVAIAIQQANIYQQTQIEIHQRQQAEELIKQQLAELKIWKNRYELASTVSGQIMYEYNLLNDAPVWPANMEEILGYSYSECPRNLAEFMDIVHPEDRDRLYSLIQKKLAHKSPLSTEYRLRRKDGNYIWVEDRNQVVLDDQGEIVVVIGAIVDITVRKNSEEKLSKLFQKSEKLQERLSLVLKGSNDAWWDWDLLEDTIYYSARWFSLLGYKHEELYLKSESFWENFMHPEDIDPIRGNFNQALDDKNIEFIESKFRLRHKQEYYIFINCRSYILRDETGKAVRVSGANTDITQLVRKEEELQATLNQLSQFNQKLETRVQKRTVQLQNLSSRLELAIKAAKIAIWEWDIHNNHTIWDKKMYELYGVKPSEYRDCMEIWHRSLHPEDAVRVNEIVKNKLKDGEEFEMDFRIVLPDGKIRVLQSYGIIKRDSQGKAERVIGVNRDITNLKEAEQKIKQQAEREYLLRETTQRIRQSLDLHTIFNTAAAEIRQLMNADRVGIFKFDPDSNFNYGEFVSESVVSGFISALEMKVHDQCFGEKFSPDYAAGRMQIVDDIDNAGLADCHRDLLARFQVKANLVVPLIQGKNLWGLLCIHQCSQPRHWEDFEIELVQQIANQLAIAIKQSMLYEQVQSELIIRKQAEVEIYLQLQRQRAIQDITQEIRSSLNLNHILTTITTKVRELTQAERVIVFRLFPDGKSQIVEEAVANGYMTFKDSYWEDEKWSQDVLECYWQGKPRIVLDVMDDIWTDCLRAYSLEGNIRSKIVAPILQDLVENETGRWVNHPHNKLWGVLVVHACGEKRIWEESEAELLQQIANQLAIAIQQADLFDKLQKSLKQEKEISAMRSRFISMVSHEFRTPLAIISSSTGILQTFGDRLNTEKKQGHLETIQKTIKYTVQLLDDVLMINSVETEKIEFKPETLDIIDFCRRLIREIQGTSYSHVIDFSLNSTQLILDHTLFAEFDPKIIRQVLTNLLTNAIKYSPGSSTVSFSLNITDKQIVFIVQDYGIGISETDQVNLFASFYRGSNVGNISGTGLGLAIVKKCVDQHQGKITLESKLNQGTIFKVTIPRYNLMGNG